ncbi:hypothetical protein BK661_08350 [Pseudomonas frederiksbergensis]|jgi:hypothetical protein|uniref:DUF262 domain-containing protein n=1 Tax=Pseudomonas frederiksbergensis TaxID=104087 RepID=A0A423J8S0_9PSED|nr:hypothetical protein [Pseudomonas frederiksbergensis]RON34095.1 hypothetical protein BK661_08350 [Pseudomonas frederiksbergensis]
MKYSVLDEKREGDKVCLLIKATLSDYIETLPVDYAAYDIQRAIVNNIYLDGLVYTVLAKGHIPSITLIAEEDSFDADADGKVLTNFKILDGLQRTHRLKMIKSTKDLYLRNLEVFSSGLSDFQLKRKFRKEVSEIGSTGNILVAIKAFYESNGREALDECFDRNFQWFELWRNLTPQDEVKKMLLLNAGHKPVNIKHQLELLFNNILPMMDQVKSKAVDIIKEKNVSSSNFNSQRGVGVYHFSHLISALLSYVQKKPVTTNSDLVQKIQSDEDGCMALMELFTYEFLDDFLKSIKLLDDNVAAVYGEEGVLWFGREVTLAALFAAIGHEATNLSDISRVVKPLVDNIKLCNLSEYEEARKNLDPAKVNLGGVNKRYIFTAFTAFMKSGCENPIDWSSIFKGVAHEEN